ncbi:MAG TPA: hypothetical protein VE262_19095 [Blastocatellia bacterium]|nr:hypothetical protein [Blastocatellia bacterium]
MELGETELSQTGRWILSIDANGKVTGKETNNVNDRTADLSGAINEEDSIKLILGYPNEASIVKGTVIKTKRGHLKGTLSQSGKVIWTIEIDSLPE